MRSGRSGGTVERHANLFIEGHGSRYCT
jgi:hypothetical protein